MFKKSALLFFNIVLSFILVFTAYQTTSVAVFAAEAGDSYIRCDRMKANNSPGNCLVVFTTSNVTFTEAYLKLTLDTEWVSATHFSTTASNYTVSTVGLPGGVTAMPGIATADLVSANTIRFPVTALANNTTYGFFITGSGLSTNPTASNTIAHTLFTRNVGDTSTGDTAFVAVPTVTDDQVTVTASVAPTFTFVFGNNSQSLGTLSSSVVTSGPGTSITINTNATAGWNTWLRSTNAGIISVGAVKTINTTGIINGAPSTITAGTEAYVLDANLTTDAAGGGTVTIAGEYNGTTTSQGGTLSTTFQSVASSNGTANGDIITLIPRVTISGLTPAASDYTDTLTVVGAGIF